MKFRISGAHKDTGDDIQMTIDASDQRSAEKWAAKNGIIWTSITPQMPPPTPSNEPMPQTVKPYSIGRDGMIWLIGTVAVLLSVMISEQPIGFFDAASFGSTIGTALVSFLFIFLFGRTGAHVGRRSPKSARIGFAVGSFAFLAIWTIGEYRTR